MVTDVAPTRFSLLVHCDVPLQLAPMGGVGTPELVAAVANAGGHGMVAAVGMPASVLEDVLERVGRLTSRRIGVNFLVPMLDREALEAAATRADVIEFFFGDPHPELVRTVHAGGALASWQVGSVPEALAAEDVGCDFVVVQGIEAGGRIRGREPLAALLAGALQATKLPVVAAGGIATADSVRAVLDAGAAAARVGTRFLAAQESGAHPTYQEAVMRAGSDGTVISSAFTVLWPIERSPARVLRSCVAAAETIEDDLVGETQVGDRTLPVPRFAALAPTVRTTGSVEAMALYAGEGVGEVTESEPAMEIVQKLCATISASSPRC